jgi:hypothetical protein
MVMYSSYRKNNFGEKIYKTVLEFPPLVAVELGVLEGFSAIAITRALYKLNVGHLDAYDLWEDYKYRHSTQKEVQETIDGCGLSDFITLYKQDAYTVHENYDNRSVDLLHIDISNDGDVFNVLLENWDSKISHCGLILFEGGSEERDQLEWMIKYDKKPIKPEIKNNSLVDMNYTYKTYNAFPSLTVMEKITL